MTIKTTSWLKTQIRRDRACALLDEGKTYSQIINIMKEEGYEISKSTLSYYSRQRNRPRQFHYQVCDFDWTAVQTHYNITRSAKKTRKRFNISLSVWNKARDEKRIIVKGLRYNSENLTRIIESGGLGRKQVKRLILNNNIIPYKCKICGISSWNGSKITLQLDHENGISNDNRLENLRLLCPNCHSQTDTYCSKNIKNPNRVPKKNYRRA